MRPSRPPTPSPTDAPTPSTTATTTPTTTATTTPFKFDWIDEVAETAAEPGRNANAYSLARTATIAIGVGVAALVLVCVAWRVTRSSDSKDMVPPAGGATKPWKVGAPGAGGGGNDRTTSNPVYAPADGEGRIGQIAPKMIGHALSGFDYDA